MTIKKQTILFAVLLGHLFFVSMSNASQMSGGGYTIVASVFGSAGGYSGTLGQSTPIGVSTGGGYINHAGFWYNYFGDEQSPFIDLMPGLNLVGYPVAVPTDETASTLLARFLNADESGRIQRYNSATSFFDVFVDDSVSQSGIDFDIADSEGYMVYVDQKKKVIFAGDKVCDDLVLSAGYHLVTLPCATPGFSSYDLFNQLGGDQAVASIQRLNKTTGQFESTGSSRTGPAGPDFPIRGGEGYIIHMK
jgi:hypothetical protein